MINLSTKISTIVLLAIVLMLVIQTNCFPVLPIFAQDNSKLKPSEEPATLVIATNPKTPGIQIFIDGIPYKSDNSGNIVFKNYTGKYRIETPTVLSSEETKESSSSFFTFGRWRPFMPQNFTITLTSGIDAYFQLGLVRVSDVKLEFLDANLGMINKSNVDRVVLVSNNGEIKHVAYPFKAFLENNYFSNEQRSNIKEEQGLTIVSLPELQINPLKFKVSEVLIDDVNVVDKSKNKEFYPQNVSSINTYSRVYPLKIGLTDRVFGSPLEGSISIENIDKNQGAEDIAPEESKHRYKVVDGELNIPQLPKGIYVLKTDSGIGLGGTAAVVLSKPQEVTISLISYRSIAILATILIIVLLIAIVTIRKILGPSILKSGRNKNSAIQS
jgi:hypothetical protein